MLKVDAQKIYQLLVQVQEEMRAGFRDADIKLTTATQSLENRLNNRIDELEERIEQVRQTQLEDSRAINSVLMRHDRDIRSLKRWKIKCAAQ